MCLSFQGCWLFYWFSGAVFGELLRPSSPEDTKDAAPPAMDAAAGVSWGTRPGGDTTNQDWPITLRSAALRSNNSLAVQENGAVADSSVSTHRVLQCVEVGGRRKAVSPPRSSWPSGAAPLRAFGVTSA